MNKVWTLAIAIALLVLDATADGLSPHETVEQATDQVLEKLAEVRSLYESDPEQFYLEIKTVIAPIFDFDRFARGVMAKYYRKATPEQISEFRRVFEDDLVTTYAKLLLEFDAARPVMLPADERVSAAAEVQKVKMEFHSNRGSVYPVQYSMTKKSGNWKVKNVVVKGINIGLQFRSQFSSSMRKNKGDINKVIRNWDSKVTK